MSFGLSAILRRLIIIIYLFHQSHSFLCRSYLQCRKHKNSIINNPHLSRASLIYLKNNKFEQENYDEEFEESFNERIEKKLEEKFPTTSKSSKKKNSNRMTIFQGLTRWKHLNRAVLAGVFVSGIGAGITIDSAVNTNPKDLASRDAIDRNAPNPRLCATYGSSAMVLDQRVFVTFNPFNVYVTQADTKPGCVLRPSNVVPILKEERKLLTDADIESCKNGYNTWAFIGDINNKPQLNCVFQSDDAQNEFLSNPKVGLGEDVYDDKGIQK